MILLWLQRTACLQLQVDTRTWFCVTLSSFSLGFFYVLLHFLLALCILCYLIWQDMDASEAKDQIADEKWFHGILPREEVQRLLVCDGDFLVRESKNKKTSETQFVLSVFWQGPRHFIIQFSEVRSCTVTSLYVCCFVLIAKSVGLCGLLSLWSTS